MPFSTKQIFTLSHVSPGALSEYNASVFNGGAHQASAHFSPNIINRENFVNTSFGRVASELNSGFPPPNLIWVPNFSKFTGRVKGYSELSDEEKTKMISEDDEYTYWEAEIVWRRVFTRSNVTTMWHYWNLYWRKPFKFRVKKKGVASSGSSGDLRTSLIEKIKPNA